MGLIEIVENIDKVGNPGAACGPRLCLFAPGYSGGVRLMFGIYLFGITAGIVFFTVVGLSHG
jgi:hypothetical protein